MSVKILVVDDDPVNLTVVDHVLSSQGYSVYQAQSGPAALTMLESLSPDLIVLDVMMPDMSGYEVCERIRSTPKFADVYIIMLTASNSVENRIKGFEVGADDFMGKPFHPEELHAHIEAFLRRRVSKQQEKASESRQCKTIAFFSLRGGTGVSTLATNLSVALSQIWQTPTVLIDLVLTCGQSAMMLNQTLRTTWADLARIPVDEYTAELIDEVLMKHDTDVRILAAPPSSELAELVTGESVEQVLDILSQHYEYIVLDLPHDFRDTTLAALDKTEQIVVIFEPEISSVYAAKRALDTFHNLEYPKERILLIMNWTFSKRGLARDSIESVLGRKISYVLPFADNEFIDALNRGIPALIYHKGKPLAGILEDLAFSLSKPEHQNTPPSSPSAMWKRIMTRKKTAAKE
jgi:pilus assembly protein CpaE